MYYIPLLLTVLANVIYHIAQKYTPEKVNPYISLIATYLVALIICVVMYLFSKKEATLSEEISYINGASLALGVAIFLLELGFLLAYRMGWNVSTASITSTVLVTAVLIPVGLMIFKETLSTINVVGIILSVTGVILMSSGK